MNTPRGIRNNNPGNLRHYPAINWLGMVGQDDDNFCVFESMEYGVRAAVLDLIAGFKQAHKSGGRQGEDTVAEIIEEWAPANENDTAAYFRAVCRDTGFDRDEILPLTPETLTKLARAIFRHENGGHFVTLKDLDVGVGMACQSAGVS